MANQAQESKVSLAAIGEKLRAAREKRGLTIEQAQKQTHIHTTVLAALEDGRCDEILTPNYVKSFLKEYAAFLGFESKEVVSEYLALHPELYQKNININRSVSTEGIDLSFWIRAARFVIIAAVAIFLSVFLYNKVNTFIKKKQEARVPLPERFTKAKAKPAAASQKKPQTKTSQPPKGVPFSVTIKIKSPTMVQVKKDGVILFRRPLSKGAQETFNANSSVNILVGKAEALEVILNGKSLGSPGRGVIRDLEITSNGMRVK